jgi:hypothetical protein
MANPLYPDVPLAPGVPPVLRDSPAAPPVRPLTSDNAAAISQYGPQWGIFDATGGLAVEPDNIVAFEANSEFRIADYPIENGKFESYNKVQMPYDLRVVMSKGGNDLDRSEFLAAISNLVGSTLLYSVVTPDSSYTSVNAVRYDYRRSAEAGATLLTVEVQCRQVRTTARIAFTSSKTASGSAIVNDGPVQTTSAPANVGAPQ